MKTIILNITLIFGVGGSVASMLSGAVIIILMTP